MGDVVSCSLVTGESESGEEVGGAEVESMEVFLNSTSPKVDK